jgi:mannosyl-3-phosphoglycerate synthase
MPGSGKVPRMRLEQSHRTERFGAVRIHELQRVVELDSGDVTGDRGRGLVSQQDIRAIEQDMVVVIPCMNETRRESRECFLVFRMTV